MHQDVCCWSKAFVQMAMKKIEKVDEHHLLVNYVKIGHWFLSPVVQRQFCPLGPVFLHGSNFNGFRRNKRKATPPPDYLIHLAAATIPNRIQSNREQKKKPLWLTQFSRILTYHQIWKCTVVICMGYLQYLWYLRCSEKLSSRKKKKNMTLIWSIGHRHPTHFFPYLYCILLYTVYMFVHYSVTNSGLLEEQSLQATAWAFHRACAFKIKPPKRSVTLHGNKTDLPWL